mgnify:CR=1 FL=1
MIHYEPIVSNHDAALNALKSGSEILFKIKYYIIKNK